MSSLSEIDRLVKELNIDERSQNATSSAPSNTGRRGTPIITSQFFEACPNCHSNDVSTNKAKGYSLCETCGFAVDPMHRLSTRKRAPQLSQATTDKLALLQETHIKTNQRTLQENPAANWELFHACQENDIATVKRLLDLGYPINCKDSDTESTPLHWAAAKSQQHTIRFLVERGANINARNKRGMTPLHSLIINRVEPLAFWLIKKGADITITNNEGHTPVDLALPWTQREMEDLYAKVRSGQVMADNLGDVGVVKQVRTGGASNAPKQQQFTSSTGGDKEVMKIFLKNDAYKSMIIAHNTTAQDLCDQMADKLGLGMEFSRNFEVFERVKKGEQQYQERKIPPNANIFGLKAQWPLIFTSSGNETHLHCKFIVNIKRGSPQDAALKFRNALTSASSD